VKAVFLPAAREPDSSNAPVPTVEFKEQILFKEQIFQACRDALAQYKVPVAIRFAADLDGGTTG